MDPNIALKNILWLAMVVNDELEITNTSDAEELAELVLALDEWLRKHGALPTVWIEKPDRYAGFDQEGSAN